MDKEPGGLQYLGLQNQTDWAQNCVLNAGMHANMHAHTHADTHKRMHVLGLTCSRAQGGSSQLTAPGLCAYLEEAYLLVLKYEPEKQVSGLISIWENAKLFPDGDWQAPSFFPFSLSWWVPSSSSLSASLQLTVSPRQKLILQSESGFLPLPPHRGHL